MILLLIVNTMNEFESSIIVITNLLVYIVAEYTDCRSLHIHYKYKLRLLV